jgi:hypothetical protein
LFYSSIRAGKMMAAHGAIFATDDRKHCATKFAKWLEFAPLAKPLPKENESSILATTAGLGLILEATCKLLLAINGG